MRTAPKGNTVVIHFLSDTPTVILTVILLTTPTVRIPLTVIHLLYTFDNLIGKNILFKKILTGILTVMLTAEENG